MASCPLPSQFDVLRPADPQNPTCDELRNILLNGNNLIADLSACWFNEDGTLRDSFRAQICATSC